MIKKALVFVGILAIVLAILPDKWEPGIVFSLGSRSVSLNTSVSGFHPGAELYATAEEQLEELIKQRGGYFEIWSSQWQWPRARFNTQYSPVIEYSVANKSLETTMRSGPNAPMKKPLPKDAKLTYWDVTAPVYADLNNVISGDLPQGIVPVAQRTKDGRTFLQAWAFRGDLQLEAEAPTGKWAHSPLQNPVFAEGRLVVMERYTVLLKQGESSAILPFTPPMAIGESGWKRGWRLNTGEGVDVVAEVNGITYVMSDQDIDASATRRSDGSLTIKVTVTKSPHEVVPVTFEYYRYLPGKNHA